MAKRDKQTQVLIDALMDSNDKQIIKAFNAVAKRCEKCFLPQYSVVLRRAAKELKAAD